MPADPRKLLRLMFDAAVAAAAPSQCLPPHLPAERGEAITVLGAGKASAAMARALEDAWSGPLSGLVVTRYGHAVACRRIEIVEAAHPLPDLAGLDAARRIRDIAAAAKAGDQLFCLMSGGGSALLSLPLDGITLADKQAVSRALLESGATIAEINCVRRHLSAIKGGRLAALAHPARVTSFLISDVPGDNPADIASGPTVGDPTSCADALAIVDRYRIALPPAAREVLQSGRGETVKPDDPRLAGARAQLIATPQASLEAAAALARQAGLDVHILSDRLEGEARAVGAAMAAIARQIVARDQPFSAPCVLLSGGETTVTVRGAGRGGRNVEFLLALTLSLGGLDGVWALAGDTDGIDGLEEVAGGLIAPDSLARAWAAGLNPAAMLDDNDAHRFFAALGDGVVTGPTRTNVNDFRAILIAPSNRGAP